MEVHNARRLALVWAITFVAASLGLRTLPGTAATPAPEEIVKRVVAAQAAAGVVSANVELGLRVHKAATQPADCVFTGVLRVEQGHQSLQIQQRPTGLACQMADRYALGRLFEGQEPLESFLARFDFSVLGEKLVDGDHYYLVQGIARDPKGNPHGLMAWIDDDRAVVPEGTISYAWGDIETEQTYARLNDAWILTRQFLFARRFDASLEINYHDFTFTHARQAPPLCGLRATCSRMAGVFGAWVVRNRSVSTQPRTGSPGLW